MKVSSVFFVLVAAVILFLIDLAVNQIPFMIGVHVGHFVLFVAVGVLLYNGSIAQQKQVKLQQELDGLKEKSK